MDIVNTDYIVLNRESNRMCAIFKTESDACNFTRNKTDKYKVVMKKTTLPKPCAHLELIKNNWLGELL